MVIMDRLCRTPPLVSAAQALNRPPHAETHHLDEPERHDEHREQQRHQWPHDEPRRDVGLGSSRAAYAIAS
jgi:hypothetical protein